MPSQGTAWVPVQPQMHMWVTWANKTGQDSFCLPLATPSGPFRTCLIGVPLNHVKEFGHWTTGKIYSDYLDQAANDFCTINSGSVQADWCQSLGIPRNPSGAQAFQIAQGRNVTGMEPQELDILGSMPGNYCLFWGFYKKDIDSGNFRIHKPRDDSTWIAPGSPWHSNITGYCNDWTWPVSWSGETNEKAKVLPRGVFRVCGDGAWPAVPARAPGGPCCFGKLTLFAPSIHQMLNISNKFKRIRRRVYQLGPECTDDVELWERPSVHFSITLYTTSCFCQGSHSVETVGLLDREQINITSRVLDDSPLMSTVYDML